MELNKETYIGPVENPAIISPKTQYTVDSDPISKDIRLLLDVQDQEDLNLERLNLSEFNFGEIPWLPQHLKSISSDIKESLNSFKTLVDLVKLYQEVTFEDITKEKDFQSWKNSLSPNYIELKKLIRTDYEKMTTAIACLGSVPIPAVVSDQQESQIIIRDNSRKSLINRCNNSGLLKLFNYKVESTLRTKLLMQSQAAQVKIENLKKERKHLAMSLSINVFKLKVKAGIVPVLLVTSSVSILCSYFIERSLILPIPILLGISFIIIITILLLTIIRTCFSLDTQAPAPKRKTLKLSQRIAEANQKKNKIVQIFTDISRAVFEPIEYKSIQDLVKHLEVEILDLRYLLDLDYQEFEAVINTIQKFARRTPHYLVELQVVSEEINNLFHEIKLDQQHKLIQKQSKAKELIGKSKPLKEKFDKLSTKKAEYDLEFLRMKKNGGSSQERLSDFQKEILKLKTEIKKLEVEREKLEEEVRQNCLSFLDENEIELACNFPELFHQITVIWEADVQDDFRTFTTIGSVRNLLLNSNLLLCVKPEDYDFNIPEEMSRVLPSDEIRIKGAILKSSQEKFVLKRCSVRQIDQIRKSLLLPRKILHDSILSCEGAFFHSIDENELFIVFPFLQGGDLSFWTKAQSRPFLKKLTVLARVSEALSVMHEAKIFHRDLSPKNILLTSLENDAIPKVTDFEFSKEIGQFVTKKTEEVHGTNGFMAPELLQGTRSSKDARFLECCDVYSLGAVIAFILLLDARVESLPKDINAYPSAITEAFKVRRELREYEELCPILLECLNQNPERRPSASKVFLALSKRKCRICQESHDFRQGVLCPESQHFLCFECFNQWVESESKQEIGVREAKNGNILCPLEPQKECGNSPYELKTLQEVLKTDILQSFIKAGLELKESRDHQETQKLIEEVKRENEKKSRKQLLVDLTRDHITEEILNLRCPNCKQVFDAFDGCCSLTCSNCRHFFCGFCLNQHFGDSASSHRHVQNCVENPRQSNYHCDLPLWTRIQKDKKKALLVRYLQGLNPELRDAIAADPKIREIKAEFGI